MATEIYLIRHGHAIKVNGNYVIAPLTEIGQKQAVSTGKFLKSKIDVLYSSPIKRTMETAKIISEETGLSYQIVEGVQELRRVELPMLFLCEALSFFGPIKKYLHGHIGKQITWPIEGRVSAALLEIVAKHPSQKIGIVTHSGIISSALCWLEPAKRHKWWRHTVGNCSITRILFESDTIKIYAVDDVSHLRSNIETTQQPTVQP